MSWTLDAGRPIYLQLQEELELRIVTGQYPTGSQLPSVRLLAQEAAVNPNTMQKALQELERSGMVYTQRTSGRFVTEDREMIEKTKLHLASLQATAFLEAMRKLGFTAEEALALVKQAETEEEV